VIGGELPGRLDAVHGWHTDVHEHDVGLLFVPLIALTFLPANLWEPVQRFAPMTAGLAVQSTVGSLELIAGRAGEPIDPWAGLGLLCAYAAVALLAAFGLINRRDA
jgi:hypothetical protein